MKALLVLLMAGAAGTCCRYAAMRAVNHALPGFPCGTLLVNVIGAFAAGLVFAAFRGRFVRMEVYEPLVLVGFLGAFTTFSTYALESARMLMNGRILLGLANITAQNLLGVAAAMLGLLAGRHLFAA